VITLTINEEIVKTEDGTTVAAAILNCGISTVRRSVSQAPRGPLCGMGICFECRVTIDGVPHQRSCTTLVTPGMEVLTDE